MCIPWREDTARPIIGPLCWRAPARWLGGLDRPSRDRRTRVRRNAMSSLAYSSLPIRHVSVGRCVLRRRCGSAFTGRRCVLPGTDTGLAALHTCARDGNEHIAFTSDRAHMPAYHPGRSLQPRRACHAVIRMAGAVIRTSVRVDGVPSPRSLRGARMTNAVSAARHASSSVSRLAQKDRRIDGTPIRRHQIEAVITIEVSHCNRPRCDAHVERSTRDKPTGPIAKKHGHGIRP